MEPVRTPQHMFHLTPNKPKHILVVHEQCFTSEGQARILGHGDQAAECLRVHALLVALPHFHIVLLDGLQGKMCTLNGDVAHSDMIKHGGPNIDMLLHFRTQHV